MLMQSAFHNQIYICGFMRKFLTRSRDMWENGPARKEQGSLTIWHAAYPDGRNAVNAYEKTAAKLGQDFVEQYLETVALANAAYDTTCELADYVGAPRPGRYLSPDELDGHRAVAETVGVIPALALPDIQPGADIERTYVVTWTSGPDGPDTRNATDETSMSIAQAMAAMEPGFHALMSGEPGRVVIARVNEIDDFDDLDDDAA